ncbi:MAG TPA: glycerophosphodiester phosphodiesterase family protein [Blastocatellia bacterium]|nr:glycerophosphodiester phosphodiesterase family protein [Blastocatellia bacterium]
MSHANARRPRVIAHRGASSVAPENTLEAFRIALDLGADGVEMDVHLSADGTPVVIHDRRVDRTTDRSGRVSSLGASELLKLDAGFRFRRKLAVSPRLRARVKRTLGKIPRAAPESLHSLPALESILRLLKQSSISLIYIELKAHRNKGSELLLRTVEEVRRWKLEDRTTLISFDHDLISLIQEMDPGIRAGILIPGPLTKVRRWPSILRAARSAGASEVALHYSIATKRIVEKLHGEGLKVAAWTANNPIVMRRLLTAGVDSIITNFVDRLQNVIDTANAAEEGSRSHRKRIGGAFRRRE